jgi:ornithine cyclodeaminase/alanine dehydrogenase-like protein (mu-crystallin family)
MIEFVKRHKVAFALGAALVALAIVASVVAGCSAKGQEPFNDGPKYPDHDRTTAKIVEMPDGFSNFAVKCVGGIWITSAYHGDANRTALTTVIDPKFPDCSADYPLQH